MRNRRVDGKARYAECCQCRTILVEVEPEEWIQGRILRHMKRCPGRADPARIAQ